MRPARPARRSRSTSAATRRSKPDEGFTVTLSNASGGAQITTATAVGTIQNDDTALAIAAADAAKAEGQYGQHGVHVYGHADGPDDRDNDGRITRSPAAGANPANAADFGGTLPSGAVSFAAGETSKTITVNVSGDTAVEPDEGFTVTLSNASGGAQILTATAAGTIQNDDTALAIAAADAAKAEGNTGNTPFTFTVTRTGLTTGTTTVNYAVAGSGANPANAADFGGTLPSGVVSFAAGETSKTITVNVSGDTTVESDEGFSVTLSNASGGAQILTATAAGTIQNDDTALAIAAADAVKSEGNTGNTPFTFTVTRTGLTTGTTTVNYAVAGTGANPANAADFGGTLPSGAVSFAAGETSKTITVNVSGDTTAEPDEGFSVTLSNASGGAQITTATAVGTIQNDDTALAIAAADAAKPEGDFRQHAVHVYGDPDGPDDGNDHRQLRGRGHRSQSGQRGGLRRHAAQRGGELRGRRDAPRPITVNVSGDTLVEPDEGFSVTLSNASGGAQIITATAAGTIQNDDIGSGDCRGRRSQGGRQHRQHAVHVYGDPDGPDHGHDHRQLRGRGHGSQPGQRGRFWRHAAQRDGELCGRRDQQDDHGQRQRRHRRSSRTRAFPSRCPMPQAVRRSRSATAAGTIQNDDTAW